MILWTCVGSSVMAHHWYNIWRVLQLFTISCYTSNAFQIMKLHFAIVRVSFRILLDWVVATSIFLQGLFRIIPHLVLFRFNMCDTYDNLAHQWSAMFTFTLAKTQSQMPHYNLGALCTVTKVTRVVCMIAPLAGRQALPFGALFWNLFFVQMCCIP